MHLLYNFELIPESDFKLSFTNRAFQYNDGLFDTLMLVKGRVRFLPDHLERMQRALEVLQIQILPELQNAAAFTQIVRHLAEQNQLTEQLTRLKVHIWRAPGGLFTPEHNTAEILITQQLQAQLPPSISRADFATTVQNSCSPLSFFKGPMAAKYVLASLEKKQKQLDELLLSNDQGYVSEALVANVFWIKNHTLYTPSLQTGCIAGITRKNILRLARTQGLNLVEDFFPAAEIRSAEVVFTSNVTGLRPIHFIGQKEFARSHPILTSLNEGLFR